MFFAETCAGKRAWCPAKQDEQAEEQASERAGRAKRVEGRIFSFFVAWLRGSELHRRSSGYGPDEILLLYPAIMFIIILKFYKKAIIM